MIRKLIFCLLLCISVSVFGEEEVYSYGDFEYTIDENDEVCITGLVSEEITEWYSFFEEKTDKKEVNIVIPRTIENKLVTKIGYGAFLFCNSLTSIEIPDTVISIGDSAFSSCESLTDINIPNSVTNIGGGVFSGCKNLLNVNISDKNENFAVINNILYNKKEKSVISCFSNDSHITIPSGIKTIKAEAFSGCESLTSISIPNSVTTIGEYAFFYCKSLTSINIPDSVISIGDGVFSGCKKLLNVNISDKNENFAVINNILYNKKEKTVISCFSNDSHITIPSGIKTIEISAFSGCLLLTSITIPNSVTSIEDSAFSWCESLTNITIPDSVKSIGNFTFARCVSFTNLTIPDSVTSIGDYAFNECTSLTNLTIPDSVMSIGKEAFDDCPSLTIQCNAGSYAEQYCKENNLKYFTTPDWLLD